MQILSTFPIAQTQGVALDSVVKIKFSLPVEPELLVDGSVVISYPVENKRDIFAETDPLYSNDTFRVVAGSLSLNTNDLSEVIFIPSERYQPNTKYTVTVSKTIAGISGTQSVNGNTIKTFEYLTANESFEFSSFESDQLQTNIVVPPVSGIIGNNVTIPSATQAVQTITTQKIVSCTPSNGAVNVKSDTFEIEASDDITEYVDRVFVYVESLMNDSDRTNITSDCTISVVDNILKVKVNKTEYLSNNILYIKLNKNIKIGAETLGVNEELEFITKITPYYCPIKMIYLKAGPLVGGLSQKTLASLIAWHSYNAYIQTRRLSIDREALLIVKLKYAMYGTIKDLLNTAGASTGSSIHKILGDFQIKVTNSSSVSSYNELRKEVSDFFKDFVNMTNTLAGGWATKGINSPTYPKDIGRLWDTNAYGAMFKIRKGSILEKQLWTSIGSAPSLEQVEITPIPVYNAAVNLNNETLDIVSLFDAGLLGE